MLMTEARLFYISFGAISIASGNCLKKIFFGQIYKGKGACGHGNDTAPILPIWVALYITLVTSSNFCCNFFYQGKATV